jgi:hypothetical protein
MRSLAVVLVIPFLACGTPVQPPVGDVPDAQGPSDASTVLPAPDRGFQVVSPTIDIKPGVEVTYCYYFRTPNTADLAIRRWQSHMTPGSHHMILYFTATEQQPAGTLSTTRCGIASGNGAPVWTYSAQSSDAESALPPNDGLGNPIGQSIPAGQPGFIQMHYLNATDSVIHAHVELNAYAYDEGVQVIQAAPYVTYNYRILIQPGSPTAPTPGASGATCSVPLSNGKPPKFFIMTTHTHKQGVHTYVKDGDTMVFDSRSWEHPGATTWDTTPFYTFTSGSLTYHCDYLNPNAYSIMSGDSAATDEMCMAIGYYFPAVVPTTGPTGHFCVDGGMVY